MGGPLRRRHGAVPAEQGVPVDLRTSFLESHKRTLRRAGVGDLDIV